MAEFEDYFRAAQATILTPRECHILDRRYGLLDAKPCSLQDIGEQLGISRERVRQLIDKSLRRIRTTGYSQLKKAQLDRPPAQFINYLREQMPDSGEDGDTTILRFITDHLPYLPPGTHALPLILYFLTPQGKADKERFNRLRHQSTGTTLVASTPKRQTRRLNRLLRDVIWPEDVSRWSLHQFDGYQPQANAAMSAESQAKQFFSLKLKRDVSYLSDREYNLLGELEAHEDVIYYLERPFKVKYSFDGVEKDYNPTVFVLLKDKRGIVFDVEPVIFMALQANLTRWTALRQFCAEKGFGLVVCDGTRSIQAVQKSKIRPEIRDMILKRLEQGELKWPEYNSLRQQHRIRRREFVALVLKYRLHWRTSPFSLSMPSQ